MYTVFFDAGPRNSPFKRFGDASIVRDRRCLIVESVCIRCMYEMLIVSNQS